MNTIPFTYSVMFKLTGQYYYGYRGRRGCNPNELWTTYFTSSKLVKELISLHGQESFEIKIRKIFQTADEARSWERKFLLKVNARNNTKMLNMSNGGKGFSLSRHTMETRAKISAARLGMKFTEEHKNNIGKSSRGRIPSTETKHKISEALSGRIVSSETRQKLSISASLRLHSEETKIKIAIAGKGRKLSELTLDNRQSNKRCLVEGIEYRSLSEAARALGLSSAEAIKYRIKAGWDGYCLI